MTTLLIGANGRLGSELRQLFDKGDLVPLTHAELELTNPVQARETLFKYRPDLIPNTAAYHRVDECEDFPERAFAVNALAVRDLAIAAREIGAVLVHFSTDYVFDGRQRSPYREVDRRGIPRAGKRFLPIQWSVWMNATMDVSIVIRSKNEERFIGEVLEGLFGQEFGGTFEVIILDSGSRDGTLEIARKFPVAVYSMSPEEFTFGRALNRGAQIAKGDYVVYLSAHCTPVDQEWLIRLLQSIALKWSRSLARQEYRYCRDNGYDYQVPLIPLFWVLRTFFFWRGLRMGRFRYGRS
jgi:hypothetical protein